MKKPRIPQPPAYDPDSIEIAEAGNITIFKPTGLYYRRILRESDSSEELREIGLLLVKELEHLNSAWKEMFGVSSPRRFITRGELEDKPWLTGKEVTEL